MEKKYRIEGNDIVIDIGKSFTLDVVHPLMLYTNRVGENYLVSEKNGKMTYHGAAQNKVIIDKLDEIFGYNKDVVEGKWDKFRKYWEELGKPALQSKPPLSDGWRICCSTPAWDDWDYRLKDDPNWEVRLAWVNSGKTLEIEWLNPIAKAWQGLPNSSPAWQVYYHYRVKPHKVVDTSQDVKQNVAEQLLSSLNSYQQVLDNKLNALRYNKGKPQLSYLLDTPLANNELAKVFEAGAKKYERDNWMLGLENDKLMDSALRHLQAYAGGEEVDTETGCHHLAHADWNVKVLLEQVLASKLEIPLSKTQTKRVMESPVILPTQEAVEKFVKDRIEPLNLKSDVLGDSVILNHVRRPVHTETSPHPITTSINNLETVGGSVKSRLVLTIDLEKLMRSCPPEIRGDVAKEQEWVEKVRATCVDSLKEVNEKTALILFDGVKAEYLHYVDSSPRPIDMQFPQGYGGRFFVTRKRLAKLLNKDLAYVEKLDDGQEVLFNGATYVVKGD